MVLATPMLLGNPGPSLPVSASLRGLGEGGCPELSAFPASSETEEAFPSKQRSEEKAWRKKAEEASRIHFRAAPLAHFGIQYSGPTPPLSERAEGLPASGDGQPARFSFQLHGPRADGLTVEGLSRRCRSGARFAPLQRNEDGTAAPERRARSCSWGASSRSSRTSLFSLSPGWSDWRGELTGRRD